MSALTDLVAKWREDARRIATSQYWAIRATQDTLRQCADELEAALAAPDTTAPVWLNAETKISLQAVLDQAGPYVMHGHVIDVRALLARCRVAPEVSNG